MARLLPHHKLLRRDGLWRITNFRYLVKSGCNLEPNAGREDLRIQVVIGRVVQVGERTETRDFETIPVPIGDFPLLRRNRLVRDGELLYEQYELDEVSDVHVTLDLSPENLKIFNRFDTVNSEPIFKNTRYSSKEDSNSLFVGIGYGGDPYGIVISCVDIFSFFYANSTFLTQLVLSEAILSPELSVYDSDKSVTTGPNQKIWLKKGVPSKDARYLAMLLFDDYALNSAQSIYLHRGPKGFQAETWAIRATPPIKGKVKFKLKGRHYGNRLVVTEIIKCDWTPPFDHLEWERDKRSGTATYGAANPETTRKLLDIEPPEKISDEPGDRRTTPSELKQDYLGQRFPRLKAVSLKRSCRPEPKDRAGTRYARESVPTEEATTSLGGSGPRKRRGEVREPEALLETSQKQRELENVQLEEKDSATNQCVSSALLLLHAHDNNIAWVDFLNPGFAKTTLSSDTRIIPLCLLPSAIGKNKNAWLFSNESRTRQRVALIARVEFLGEVRFVFELEKRMSQNISTALIWNEPHSEIQNSKLAELLLLIAKPISSTERKLAMIKNNLQWGRCKHKALKGTDIKRAEEFLNRLFDTTALQDEDECD